MNFKVLLYFCIVLTGFSCSSQLSASHTHNSLFDSGRSLQEPPNNDRESIYGDINFHRSYKTSDAAPQTGLIFDDVLTQGSREFWQCDAGNEKNAPLEATPNKENKKPRHSKIIDIPIYTNQKIEAFINLYSYKKRRSFSRAIKRSAKYMKMIRRILKKHDLPMELAYLPVVESNFNPNARSRANAVGLWQFIASTGKMFGLEKSWWHDDRYDPEKSTVAAAKYLKHLIKKFDGQWELALAAYNSGEGKVGNAIKRARKRNGKTDFWSLKLPRETKSYVPAFLAVVTMFNDLETYGFKQTLEWREETRKQFIKTAGGISTKKLAQSLNLRHQTIKAMNPALRRGNIVPPNYRTYKVAIPADVKITGQQRKKLAVLQKVIYKDWKIYKVVKGDTLWSIARLHQASISQIEAFNPSVGRKKILKIGQKILMPIAAESSSTRDKAYASYKKTQKINKFASTTSVTHKVQKGDTLWDISRKYNVPIKKIRYLNPQVRKKILKMGSNILLKKPKTNRAMLYY